MTSAAAESMSTGYLVFGAGTLARMIVEASIDEGMRAPAGLVLTGGAASGLDSGIPVHDLDVLGDGWIRGKEVVVAVGSRGLGTPRREIHRRLLAAGALIRPWVSRRASVYASASLGQGCIVLPGSIVESRASIGTGAVLWCGSHVAHDTDIGAWSFLGPGAVVSGHCAIGERCFVGSNSTILDHVRIGPGSVVGAGATVARDVDADTTVAGPRAIDVATRPGQTSAAIGGDRRCHR